MKNRLSIIKVDVYDTQRAKKSFDEILGSHTAVVLYQVLYTYRTCTKYDTRYDIPTMVYIPVHIYTGYKFNTNRVLKISKFIKITAVPDAYLYVCVSITSRI